ncbi:MAG: hypothetical protein HYZ14_13105 [Bacteroidetes bacterium]|nr:hypothetical protein [Bacteroidota bacterium]
MRSSFFILLLFIAGNLVQAQVILHDEFNDNSNHWQQGVTAVSDVKVDTRRSMYHIEHKSKVSTDAWTVWTEVDLNESKNFRITAQLYKEKGVKNYGYGLLWGGTENNYYSFLVSPGGFYCVGKVVDGDWQDITPEGWIETSTVSCGNHAFNKLTISKIGDTYHFEVNDLKVATMKCGPFFGNKLGFNVNNKQRIMVDWIKVEYI